MPRTKSKSQSRSPTPSQSRSRSRSVATSSPPLSDHDNNESDRTTNEYRLHLAELPQGTSESEVRKVFERFGTLNDVWVASASCFGFVVYKQKEEAQKAIDEMDGRTFGKNRIKVTWARPRAKNRSQRYDPNMKCFKCGIRGHFSRECESRTKEAASGRRRRDDDRERERDRERDRYSSSRSKRHSRSRSPRTNEPLSAPAYFRHGMPMYPAYSRRHDDYMDNYYPMSDRSNGHDHRYRDRGTRLTPPSTSARYSRR